LLDEAGGVTTVMHDHMQRAPSLLFPSARAARAFGQWLPERFEDIKAAAETGSGRLAETGQDPPSRMLSTRFHYTTADAAGQKLTGKATQPACRWIVEPCQPGERRLARTTIDRGLGSAA
jgi:hydroxymethylglutaryl-CoA reductase (NADPH)